jgi:hypothetical protein
MRKPSQFSARTAARLGLAQMTITTTAVDLDLLEHAAAACGVSATSLVASIVHTHHAPSFIRSTAGLAGFLILTQALHRSER